MLPVEAIRPNTANTPGLATPARVRAAALGEGLAA